MTNEDELDRLKTRQTEIYGEYGVWGSTGLARSCEQAAGEALLIGQPTRIEANLATEIYQAGRELHEAAEVLADITKLHLDGAWAGSAHTAAGAAIKVLQDDVLNAHLSFNTIATSLSVYGERLGQSMDADPGGQQELTTAAAAAAELTWGPIPKLAGLGYDGEAMREAHHLAMSGIDNRVRAHTEAMENARQLTTELHDIATKARSAGVRSGLSSLDNLLIASAGGDQAEILTPAMEKRAAAAMDSLNASDRDRWNGLLSQSESPEQQAYLMKALAAGYSLNQITQFNTMIAAHGDNPEWLAQHLNPLPMDGTPTPHKQPITFDGTSWDQGNHPTCVAASTVAARAEVDPLYALQLTTGGHPGDPAYDDPAAFTARLRAEQSQLYDDNRTWFEKHFTNPGLTDSESKTVANDQIASHTGVSYQNVPMGDEQSRAATVPSVERAVDDGYPVPLTTREDGDGHGMVVIGHSGDQLQIYNPWGYTFWVSEQDFVSGDIDAADSDMPKLPTSVRLPQGAK